MASSSFSGGVYFRWVPGYLHQAIGDTDSKEVERLERDAALASESGFEAVFMDRVPWAEQPGVRFSHQAKFHPRRYLARLLHCIPGDGSHVFENTALEEVEEKPLAVKANGKTIRCQYLIVATHNPLMGRQGMLNATLFQTKLALYTSYVLGAHLPKGAVPEGLFWDTANPYQYLRIDAHEDRDYAILGGEDVKTGQEGRCQWTLVARAASWRGPRGFCGADGNQRGARSRLVIERR